MLDQIIVFSVIVVILILFIDGRIRYDFVSLGGLVVLSLTGVISPEESGSLTVVYCKTHSKALNSLFFCLFLIFVYRTFSQCVIILVMGGVVYET
jgi:hypothetical protein